MIKLSTKLYTALYDPKTHYAEISTDELPFPLTARFGMHIEGVSLNTLILDAIFDVAASIEYHYEMFGDYDEAVEAYRGEIFNEFSDTYGILDDVFEDPLA